MSALSESELARLERFLSAHEHRFALGLVRIPQIPLRDEFSARIEQWCAENHRLFLRFKLAGMKPDQVWERIRSGMAVGAVAILDDLDAAFHEPTEDLASLLNRQRERIAELLPGPVLLVLGEGAINRLFVDAPDLADWHAATFEFEGAMPAAEPRAEDPPIPERSAEWIESRIALLEDQLGASSMRDRSRAGVLIELAGLYRDSVYAVSSRPERPRSRNAFEGLQLAEAALREAVDLRRHLTKRDPSSGSELDLARALNALAQFLKSSGRYADAGPLSAEALQIFQRERGDEDPETLRSINYLAGLYARQDRYSEAESLYMRVLAASERVLGADHPDTLGPVNNLALLREHQDRYAEAESLYMRALTAKRRVLGSDHPSTLTTEDNRAVLCARQGRYAEAEPLHLRVLAAKERVLGFEHPSTLATVNNLAGMYADQGRYAEAEQFYQRALTARERVLGAEHPNTLTTMNNLGEVYADHGRYVEAEQLYRRALAARERVLGREHQDTLASVVDLAELYARQGRYVEAEPLIALIPKGRVLASQAPSALVTVNHLAGRFEKQGRYEEA